MMEKINSSDNSQYTFIPWVRRGLAALINTECEEVEDCPANASLTVKLNVHKKKAALQGTAVEWEDYDSTVTVEQLSLYGPGDITGIDAREIVRVEPADLTRNAEKEFFPLIEFQHPDFPWLFTPLPSDNNRLSPWLVLIVVPKDNSSVTITVDPDRPLPVLSVKEDMLPNLRESWQWAHVQVAGKLEEMTQLGDLLKEHPERVVSRLLCLQDLVSNTAYYACLVPVFEVGRKAGLGERVTPAETPNLCFAWNNENSATINLPVYYHWEFSTGDAGNFESLVRLLKARKLPLSFGQRLMDIGEPGFNYKYTDDWQPLLGLGGALQAPGSEPSPWLDCAREAFQAELLEIVNSSAEQPSVDSEHEPVVAPPIYGRWHAAVSEVPVDNEPYWLGTLNRDPRYRVAAGFGTLVVQKNQEQLMASAWEQVGNVEEANSLLRLAQLGREVSNVIYEKQIKALSIDLLLLFTSPLHSRILIQDDNTKNFVTIRKQFEDSRIPLAVFSPAFMRLALKLLAENNGKSKFIEDLINGDICPAGERKSPDKAVHLDEFLENLGDNDLLGDKIPADFHCFVNYMIRLLENGQHEPKTFCAAALEHLQSISESGPSPDTCLEPDLDSIKEQLIEAINPENTITRRISGRIDMPPGIWNPEDPLEPIMVAPEFSQPMYKPLSELAEEYFLPGISKIQPNTITLLETDCRFVESYMVGLNHELARELLWRGFPTDQRGTCFRRFWETISGNDENGEINGFDIPAIHEWPASKELGENMVLQGDNGQLVLLIRGELIRRYPRAMIYAIKAVRDNNEGNIGKRRPARDTDGIANIEWESFPIFRGALEPDITFFGFNLSENDARGSNNSETGDDGWFFIIQEQPTEPRFGINKSITITARTTEPQSSINSQKATENQNSASLAQQWWKPPLRVAIHASRLLPLYEQAQETVRTGGSLYSNIYHTHRCHYINRILPDNLIWFEIIADAIDAAYIPCKICKPPPK